jgi:hypothetical protein
MGWRRLERRRKALELVISRGVPIRVHVRVYIVQEGKIVGP